MTQKAGMIEELGEEALLLPALVQEALVANERAKYYISLLQAARAWAGDERIPGSLRAEREAAGISDASLDEALSGAAIAPDGRYRIPHLDRILAGAQEAIDAMVRPFAVRGDDEADRFCRRRDALAPLFRPRGCNGIDRAGIGAIASGDPLSGDSPHLLVMDLHRALTRLVEGMACEEVDGARSYLLSPGDRALVGAFMRGLNRTRALRFGHPGLETTAIRVNDRLLIQNEIGVTGAHVMVISITGTAVTVTCTDVHAARLSFFRSLLEGWGVKWSETVSRPVPVVTGGAVYYLSVGRFVPTSLDGAAAFLEHLGSRVVFLIDWNKARKQLRFFLPNQDAVAVLRWAAENGIGHRAFLELGGADLADEAVDLAGARGTLVCLLGRDGTVATLEETLAAASGGLLRGDPRPELRDRCRAVLVEAIEAARTSVQDLCAAHAALVMEGARLLADSIAAPRSAAGKMRVLANAALAGWHEREADLLAWRVIARSGCVEGGLPALIAAQERAMDALAEACLCAAQPGAAALSADEMDLLAEMAESALAAASAHLRAIRTIRHGEGCSEAERAGAVAAARGGVAADVQGTIATAISRALNALADAASLLQEMEPEVPPDRLRSGPSPCAGP